MAMAKMLSQEKLAEVVKNRREQRGLTQTDLQKKTDINRVTIGRIEKGEFIPSIRQLEALAEVLSINLDDLFIEERREETSFAALRSEELSEEEKEGLDTLFEMMLSLRQQVVLRDRYEKTAKK